MARQAAPSALFWRLSGREALVLGAVLLLLTLSRLGRAQELAENAPRSSAPASVSQPRLTYTRTLPGSVPEYLSVSVNRDGSGNYEGRRLDESGHPRPLRLSPATTRKVFALAAELNNFHSIDLDSRKKVANLGLKTFSYQKGEDRDEVRFNFTEQRPARDLVDLFEGVASVEEAIDSLEYSIKYDPLSLPQQLLSIQIALGRNELVDPQLMVPPLQQILSNNRFLHVAQVRAQDILNAVGPDK